MKPWQAVTVSVIVTLAVAAAGVFAALKSDTFNTAPQHIDSGTLNTTLSAGTFTTPLTNMAPGDVRTQRYTLHNNGTLPARKLEMTAVDSTATFLTTDPTRGLQVQLDACTVQWRADSTCPGTTFPIVTKRAVANVTPATPATHMGNVIPGGVAYLKLIVSLPNSNEVSRNGVLPNNTIQGLSANITWKLTTLQDPPVTAPVGN